MKEADIEQLLRWAYVEELPKQGIDARGWDHFALLGTSVDVSHGESTHAIAFGDPHPDALLLDYKVRQLSRVTLTLPIARQLLGELSPYLTREVVRIVETGIVKRGRREIAGVVTGGRTEKVTDIERREVSPATLVALHAKLGNRPNWNLGQPRVIRVLGPNNKPVVNGITKGRRYADGAHCPLQLEPSAEHIIRARFEYAAWHAALRELASCRMDEHRALPPRAAVEPWITGEEAKPKVHRGTTMQVPQARQRLFVELPPLRSSHGKPRSVLLTTPDDQAC